MSPLSLSLLRNFDGETLECSLSKRGESRCSTVLGFFSFSLYFDVNFGLCSLVLSLVLSLRRSSKDLDDFEPVRRSCSSFLGSPKCLSCLACGRFSASKVLVSIFSRRSLDLKVERSGEFFFRDIGLCSLLVNGFFFSLLLIDSGSACGELKSLSFPRFSLCFASVTGPRLLCFGMGTGDQTSNGGSGWAVAPTASVAGLPIENNIGAGTGGGTGAGTGAGTGTGTG